MGLKLRWLAAGLPAAILLLCFLVMPVYAAEAGTLAIEQAWCLDREIALYFNAGDLQGNPLGGIEQKNIKCQLNQQSLPIKSLARYGDQAEGIAWVVLIDVSRSLNQEQFAGVRAAALGFIQQMSAKDRAALISFGAEVKVASGFSNNKGQLASLIDGLEPVGENTRLHEALLQALDIARRRDTDLPVRRAILLISDGCEDYYGGASKDEVLANLKISPVPVYTLGIISPAAGSDTALESLGEIARASGGRAWQYDSAGLAQGVAVLLAQVQETYVMRLDAANSPRDGKDYRLLVDLQQNGAGLQDGIDLYMTGEAAPPAEKPAPSDADTAWKGIESIASIKSLDDLSRLPLWIWAVAGGLVLILICLIIILIVKRRGKSRRLNQAGGVNPGFSVNENTSDYEAARFQASSHDAETYYEPFPAFNLVNGPGTAVRPLSEISASGLELARDNEPQAGPAEEGPQFTITLNVLGKERDSSTFKITVSLAKPVATIGRVEGNDIVLAGDDRVSARHCQFIYESNKIYMQDTNSTNGTLVNGVPITGRYALENNDLILIGKTELRYSAARCDGGPLK